MKRLPTILCVLAVVAVAAAFPLKSGLQAQQPTPAGTTTAGSLPLAGRFPRIRWMLRRLNASDAQKQTALGVLRNHQAAIRPLVDRLVTERRSLRVLFKAPAVDEAAVRAESARVATVEADLAVQKAYLLHDLRAVATPEQLQTLDEIQASADARVSEVLEKINDWIANS